VARSDVHPESLRANAARAWLRRQPGEWRKRGARVVQVAERRGGCRAMGPCGAVGAARLFWRRGATEGQVSVGGGFRLVWRSWRGGGIMFARAELGGATKRPTSRGRQEKMAGRAAQQRNGRGSGCGGDGPQSTEPATMD